MSFSSTLSTSAHSPTHHLINHLSTSSFLRPVFNNHKTVTRRINTRRTMYDTVDMDLTKINLTRADDASTSSRNASRSSKTNCQASKLDTHKTQKSSKSTGDDRHNSEVFGKPTVAKTKKKRDSSIVNTSEEFGTYHKMAAKKRASVRKSKSSVDEMSKLQLSVTNSTKVSNQTPKISVGTAEPVPSLRVSRKTLSSADKLSLRLSPDKIQSSKSRTSVSGEMPTYRSSPRLSTINKEIEIISESPKINDSKAPEDKSKKEKSTKDSVKLKRKTTGKLGDNKKSVTELEDTSDMSLTNQIRLSDININIEIISSSPVTNVKSSNSTKLKQTRSSDTASREISKRTSSTADQLSLRLSADSTINSKDSITVDTTNQNEVPKRITRLSTINRRIVMISGSKNEVSTSKKTNCLNKNSETDADNADINYQDKMKNVNTIPRRTRKSSEDDSTENDSDLKDQSGSTSFKTVQSNLDDSDIVDETILDSSIDSANNAKLQQDVQRITEQNSENANRKRERNNKKNSGKIEKDLKRKSILTESENNVDRNKSSNTSSDSSPTKRKRKLYNPDDPIAIELFNNPTENDIKMKQTNKINGENQVVPKHIINLFASKKKKMEEPKSDEKTNILAKLKEAEIRKILFSGGESSEEELTVKKKELVKKKKDAKPKKIMRKRRNSSLDHQKSLHEEYVKNKESSSEKEKGGKGKKIVLHDSSSEKEKREKGKTIAITARRSTRLLSATSRKYVDSPQSSSTPADLEKKTSGRKNNRIHPLNQLQQHQQQQHL